METNIKLLLVLGLIIFLSSCWYDDGYRIEGNRVLYEMPWNTGHGTRVFETDAEAKTFEILGGNNLLWAKDNKNIFLRGRKLDFFDPNTFILLNKLFAKDDKTVSCDYQPIEEADTATFEVKDFQNLSGKKVQLGIDKHAAYKCFDGDYRYMPVKSIETFELLYDAFYKDEFHVYWWGTRLPLDVNNLKLLDGRYIADNAQVYYTDKPVVGADIESFQVVSEDNAKDEKYKYKYENRME
ncbi:DKNYY domain-containing protein [Marinicella sp. S1101]|uniref:DKNYY domain-containing protein n=1 Tax=Marinicella marina TaxID=2996016 RepID=UPI002260C0A6|nr:DKNYY domain-containing protein [Marinicella marina]MCX7554688.1 DKNYY domain-containing protein [Marinicella marina]MDJ1140753.1 DKNYY domain-containing protein [Marinicella marina]